MIGEIPIWILHSPNLISTITFLSVHHVHNDKTYELVALSYVVIDFKSSRA